MEQILQKSLISQMKSKLHTVERETGHNIQKFNNKQKIFQSTQLLKLILKIETLHKLFLICLKMAVEIIWNRERKQATTAIKTKSSA